MNQGKRGNVYHTCVNIQGDSYSVAKPQGVFLRPRQTTFVLRLLTEFPKVVEQQLFALVQGTPLCGLATEYESPCM